MKTKTMKTALAALFMVSTCLHVFAQGKVTTGNDANHLVVFATNAALLPARYAPYAGQPVPQSGTPNDQFQYFTVDLLAGPSATQMTLQFSATPAGKLGMADGRVFDVTLTLTNVAGGTIGYFQQRVWEMAGGSYENAAVRGETPVFSGTAGSFAPNPLSSMANWAKAPIILAAVQQAPAAVPPTLLVPSRSGNLIHLSFLAQSNRTYTVEVRHSLTAPDWTTLTTVPAQATDTVIQVSDTITATNCYYRVRTP